MQSFRLPLAAFVVATLLVLPSAVGAEGGCPDGQTPGEVDGTSACVPISTGAGGGGEGGASSGGGAGRPATLENPLPTSDISTIVGNVLRAMFGILGSIALLMFIYGGFTWLTSGGNPEKIKKGQDTMVWAVLGIAITFAAYAIVNFVIGALTSS